MSEWISVKDRLPKEEGEYLTVRPSYVKGGCAVLDICGFSKCLEKFDKYEFSGKNYAGFYEYDECGYLESKCVTHWMPLPEPPEV